MKIRIYFWVGLIVMLSSLVISIFGDASDGFLVYIVGMLFFIQDDIEQLKNFLNEPKPPQQD